MAGKPRASFESNVNKRVTALIKGLNALAQLGPRCENPEHAVKVTSALSAAVQRIEKNWKGKTAAPKDVFTL
jgi:hypothetical protein